MSGGSPAQSPRKAQDGAAEPGHTDAIVAVVQDLLESDGYDAVQLREVARRARVSLATIYRLFSSRDELIVTSIERWMSTNSYAELALPEPGESVYDGLMRGLRYVFEPWERNPRMLEAYHRAHRAGGKAARPPRHGCHHAQLQRAARARRPGVRQRR